MSKKLRVGLIGASPSGSWGSVAHIPALLALDDFELVAVSTAHLETAQETARKFGVAHAFGDPRALIEHPSVDLVTVAVRVPAHQSLVSMALSAGKHVYCEWPLGRTTAEAESMSHAATATGLANMVGFQARLSPTLIHARNLIQAGEIGTITGAHLTHSVPWQFPAGKSMSYLLDRDSGAHFLSIPGGHSIDAVCFLLGAFTRVSARMTQVRTGGVAADVARPSCDQASITGTLANGALASIHMMGAGQIGTGVRFEISGSKGDLILTSGPGGRGIQMSDLALFKTTALGTLDPVEIPSTSTQRPDRAASGLATNVAAAYQVFYDALRGGNLPRPDFHDAVARHRLIDAIQLSSDKARQVDLPVHPEPD